MLTAKRAVLTGYQVAEDRHQIREWLSCQRPRADLA